MTNVTEVACPRCRETHVLGFLPGDQLVTAWCPRSGRRYTVDPVTGATTR